VLKDDQLKAFGSMAISYTFLDWKVTNAVAWLRQGDPELETRRMANERKGFCSKLKEIRRLAEETASTHGVDPKQVCAKIEAATDRVQKASEDRNRLIHSHLRLRSITSATLVDPQTDSPLDEKCSAAALWDLSIECLDSAGELECEVRDFMEKVAGVEIPEVEFWQDPDLDGSP
jgi:hypothetical protein